MALAACNDLWGIHDGSLMQPDTAQAGQAGEGPGGGPPDGAGAVSGHGGEGGENGGGVGGAAAGAGGEGAEGGEASTGGVSGGGFAGSGGSGVSGGSGGNAGSMSGSGGGGTGPSCSGCTLNETTTQNQACGRCGTGSQSRTGICDANCTWQWSAWSVCSQCDTQNYRCCGAGKWEWCYDSDCAWTNDCAACSASSCPDC